MAAVTITDLNKAKENTDFIDRFSTSEEETTLDRLGRVRRTLAGVEAYISEHGILSQALDALSGAEGYASSAATAAEVSAAAGKVYATPAAGVNPSGGVAAGQYYWTPSAASSYVLELWRNVAGVATDTSKRTASSELVNLISLFGLGQGVALDAPNLIPIDWRAQTLGAVGVVPVAEVKNGVSCLKVPPGLRRIALARSAVSGSAFDASVALIAKDAGADCRVAVLQLDAGGVEIGPARKNYSITTSAVSVPIYIEFLAAAIDPACVTIEIFLDSGGTANSWWAVPTFAKATGNARWRPKWTEKTIGDAIDQNTLGIAAFRGSIVAPNVVADPYFSDLTRLLGGPSPTAVVEVVDGVPALKVTGTNRYVWVSRSEIPGAVMSASVAIPKRTTGAGARVLLMQYTAAAEIGGVRREFAIPTASLGPLVAQFDNVPIDPACVVVRILLDPGASTTWFMRPSIAPDTVGVYRNPDFSLAKVYVSPGGSDVGTGSKAMPFASVSRAIAALKGWGTIVMREGDYGAFGVTGFNGRIVAYSNERVRVLNGIELASIAKTAGYTSVYQAALAAKPAHYVWEHDTPDATAVISAAERHPLQRGEASRLPSTRMLEVVSIAAVDASPTPAWFHSAGVIYFKTSDGNAPGVRKIMVPQGSTAATSCIQGGSGDEVIEMIGLRAMYGFNGFRFTACASVRLIACDALCNVSDGISINDTPSVELDQVRAGGNGNDGTNGHATLVNAFKTQLHYRVRDSWCHDNWDDGDSLHELCIGAYSGGLYEYNGSGIATAFGAHVTLHGGLVRKNGLISGNGNPSPKNIGVGVVGAAADGGVGSQMVCYETISDSNGRNFAATDAGNLLECNSTKSLNAAVFGYSGTSGGKVKTRDATDAGSAAVKEGDVTSLNSTLVV